MARNQGWKFLMGVLVGLIGGSVFWVYGPYLEREVERRVSEGLKDKAPVVEMGPSGPVALKDLTPTAGRRYHLVSDGKQTFLADLQEGRVWRYYHHTRESGYFKEEEGFLPLPFYWGGRKIFSAAEVENLPKKEERRGKSEAVD